MSVLDKELESKGSMTKLKKIVHDFNDLMNKHVELFTNEIKTETILTGKIGIALVLSVIVAYTAFIFAGVFLTLLLGLMMPIATAALIVTGLYTLGSIGLLLMARHYFNEIKRGNESVKSQLSKTMECAKKWLTDFK